MRKKHQLISGLVAVLAMVLVMSCGGGGGGGGLQPPTYNLTGIWNVTETTGVNTCGDPTGVQTISQITVTHAEGSNSFTMTNGANTYTATISGAHITYSGTGTSSGCTSLTQTWDYTASDASHISGSVHWTCQYTGGSCTGTDSINATKQGVPAPTISSFNPTSGLVGTAVTISGTNFSPTAANNTVRFNGTAATVTNSTTTSITTSVPNGATTGPISVTVSGQTATSATNFTVTGAPTVQAPPTISSFNPTSGPVGTAVTISGTNFSATAANNTVRFNGTTATVTNSTTTSITTSVPNGATTGPISVLVSGQTATSATNFTVSGGGGGGTAEVEPNNSSTNAQLITVNQTVSGTTSGNYTAGTSDFDWYKIIPSTIGNYTITITFGSTGDLDLLLFDSSLSLLNFAETAAYGGTETVTYTLTNGTTYYIAVAPWDCTATTSYTLTVQQQ